MARRLRSAHQGRGPRSERRLTKPSLSLTEPLPAGDRGWGLRCARDLRQGEFVCEYAGEVITTTEAVCAPLAEDLRR